jgi:hypothetical protein
MLDPVISASVRRTEIGRCATVIPALPFRRSCHGPRWARFRVRPDDLPLHATTLGLPIENRVESSPENVVPVS